MTARVSSILNIYGTEARRRQRALIAIIGIISSRKGFFSFPERFSHNKFQWSFIKCFESKLTGISLRQE